MEDRAVLQAEADSVERMGSYKQTVGLCKNLDEQVLRMFKAIHAAREAQCTCALTYVCVDFVELSVPTGWLIRRHEVEMMTSGLLILP